MALSRRSVAQMDQSLSAIVGATILLLVFVLFVFLIQYAIRATDASYDRLDGLLNRSMRALLRGEENRAEYETLRTAVLSFIEVLGRVDSRSDLRREREELKARWKLSRFSGPMPAADRSRLIGSMENLETRLMSQKLSLRGSFNALLAALSVILAASLIWSASLWHRFRVNSIEAAWMQKSMRRALYTEEETRKRIARDLHDDVIQDIAAARMLCDRAAAANPASALRPPQGLSLEASAILAGAAKKLRILAHDMRPPDLERSGLVPALESLCVRNQSVFGKEILFFCAEGLPQLSDDSALQTYRIVQEAVTNSLKHARDSRIELSIGSGIRDGRQGILIQVEDRPGSESRNQRKEEPREARNPELGGLGMTIMKERASYIGARIDVEPSRSGLSLRIFIPAEASRGGENA
jgi:signal transduction histidine kinase